MTALSSTVEESPVPFPRMNRELFGVFGTEEEFMALRSPEEFDAVVSGPSVTVGIRDRDFDASRQGCLFEERERLCVIWGEAWLDGDHNGADEPARVLVERFDEVGTAAFADLNGSYLVVLDHEGATYVVPDLLRSWECFFTETPVGRAFGTDATQVARTIPEPTCDDRALNELLHFGVVFGTRTLLEELRRLPFDGYLGPDTTGELDRFVYRPSSVGKHDVAADLATRLEQAIAVRTGHPGTTGILGSAGYDSRLLMASVPELDVCYTLGARTSAEVQTARTVARQYGLDHERLPVTSRYLDTCPSLVTYTNGVRESLHIHHSGNGDQLDTDTMYHGLLLDTVLRDFYLPRRALDLFGHPLPLPGLESNPDATQFYADKLWAYHNGGELLGATGSLDARTTDDFVTETLDDALERCYSRADSVYNAMALLGVKLTPALPFRTHLADNFRETLVASDTGLIEWHLTTPPEYRTSRTFQRALARLDDDIFRHRPPDRRYQSFALSQVDCFLRRKLPGISAPDGAWPNRDRIYRINDMDARLFPDSPAVHEHPPRIKLRINDALTWLECATGRSHSPDDILRRV